LFRQGPGLKRAAERVRTHHPDDGPLPVASAEGLVTINDPSKKRALREQSRCGHGWRRAKSVFRRWAMAGRIRNDESLPKSRDVRALPFPEFAALHAVLSLRRNAIVVPVLLIASR
jgi:hypothetical protein